MTSSPGNSLSPSLNHFDVLVIGGGQAGLAMGYYLATRGLRFAILDAGPSVGHVWRSRWDSLKLITPCPYNDLPGMHFPGAKWSFPSKDDVADYLARYAQTFALPVRTGHRVERLRRDGGHYVVEVGGQTLSALAVVVATGPYQSPYIPEPARDLADSVYQIHSREYLRPSQIPEGDVLVVGCGNSGAGIAQDLAATHRVHLALGRTASSRRSVLGRDVFWWRRVTGLNQLVTSKSLIARYIQSQPDSIVGTTPERLRDEYGIALHPLVVGAEDNVVRFSNSDSHTFAAVIWATGFRANYDWIDDSCVPTSIGQGRGRLFDERGNPRHERGVSTVPGLFFLGLRWQHRIDSSLIGGVGRDAAYLGHAVADFLAGTEGVSDRASASLSRRGTIKRRLQDFLPTRAR